jgi:hypothetical protein
MASHIAFLPQHRTPHAPFSKQSNTGHSPQPVVGIGPFGQIGIGPFGQTGPVLVGTIRPKHGNSSHSEPMYGGPMYGGPIFDRSLFSENIHDVHPTRHMPYNGSHGDQYIQDDSHNTRHMHNGTMYDGPLQGGLPMFNRTPSTSHSSRHSSRQSCKQSDEHSDGPSDNSNSFDSSNSSSNGYRHRSMSHDRNRNGFKPSHPNHRRTPSHGKNPRNFRNSNNQQEILIRVAFD